MIAVAGVSGHTGRAVADTLLHLGVPVRVIVRDELSRPVGIVSSTDILAAVAGAAPLAARDDSQRKDAASSVPITPRPKQSNVLRPQNC